MVDLGPAAHGVSRLFGDAVSKQLVSEAAAFTKIIHKLLQEASSTSPELFALNFSSRMLGSLHRSYQIGYEAVTGEKNESGAAHEATSVTAGQLRYMHTFAKDMKAGRGSMSYGRRAEMYTAQLGASFLRGVLEAMDPE